MFDFLKFLFEICESDSSFLQLATARYNILSRKVYVYLLSDFLYDYVVPIISRCKTDLSSRQIINDDSLVGKDIFISIGLATAIHMYDSNAKHVHGAGSLALLGNYNICSSKLCKCVRWGYLWYTHFTRRIPVMLDFGKMIYILFDIFVIYLMR